MNELQIFNNPEFGQIRIIEIDGEPWFVGKDIATALGYSKPLGAIDRHVDEDDSLLRGVIDGVGRNQQTKLINESGMYALIIMSELPSAKKFKRWITKEVLPSIMKSGSYMLPQLSQNEMILKLAESNVAMERRVAALDDKLNRTIELFAQSPTSWRDKMEQELKTLVDRTGANGIMLRKRMYDEVDAKAGISLKNRLTRYHKRLKNRNGATHREAMQKTKLDIIARDKQLMAIFEGILKRHQARCEVVPSQMVIGEGV